MARPKEWPGLFSYQYGFKWYSEGVHANMIARKHLQVYHEYREKLGDSNKEVVRMRFILGGMICGWTPPEDGTFADNLKRAQLSQGDSVSYITIALCDSRP